MQSTSIRVDEWEAKKRDTEKWMSSENLTYDLKKRIRKYKYDNQWENNSGTGWEARLRSLPKDLRVETKRLLFSLESVVSSILRNHFVYLSLFGIVFFFLNVAFRVFRFLGSPSLMMFGY